MGGNSTFDKYFDIMRKNNRYLNKYCSRIDPVTHQDIDEASRECFKKIYEFCFSNFSKIKVKHLLEDNEIQDIDSFKKEIKEDLKNISASNCIFNTNVMNYFAYYFYKELYEFPKVIRKEYSSVGGNMQFVKEIESSKIFSEIHERLQDDKNIFITGEIGSGKTTLMKRLYIDLYTSNLSVYPIYIDILEYEKEIQEDESKFFEKLVADIKKKLGVSAIQYEESTETSENNSLENETGIGVGLPGIGGTKTKTNTSLNSQKIESVRESFESQEIPFILRNIYSSEEKKVIFLIDNLDTLNYENERFMLFDGDKAFGKFKIKTQIAKKLLRELLSWQDEIGRDKVGYICAFRPYVRTLFKLTQANNNEENLKLITEYEIVGNYADEVIEKRIELFEEIINFYSEILPQGTQKGISSLIDRYKNIFNKKKNSSGVYPTLSQHVLGELSHIANQGYRTIVNFFCNLVEINISFLEERNLNHNLILLYKLSFSKYFSQIIPPRCDSRKDNHSGKEFSYPNMFLVVADKNCNKEVSDICEPHEFSYWLKYLILLFVVYKKEKILLKDLINTFSEGKNSYRRNLVKLAIGSLGTANEYNCLQYDFRRSNIENLDELIDNTYVYPTEIGKNIIEKSLNFDISDLELFVEDWLLPKPRYDKIFCKNKEKIKEYLDRPIIENEEINYGYLNGSYRNGREYLKNMVVYKAKESLLFLYYLEISMNWEKEKHESVWEKIQEVVGNEQIFRENFFQEKRKFLIDTVIQKILGFLEEREKENIKKHLGNFNELLNQERECFNNFFKKVYENNISIPLE